MYICKKRCRSTVTKLKQFGKSKFQIKIKNSNNDGKQEEMTEAKRRWKRVRVMLMAGR